MGSFVSVSAGFLVVVGVLNSRDTTDNKFNYESCD